MKHSWVLVALLGFTTAQAQDSAQAVIDCMRANIPDSVRVQKLSFATSNSIGDTRSIQARLFAVRERAEDGKRLLRSMLRLDAPAHLAGAAYLIRETTEDYLRDGMFVYLPSVRRVRRVTGTFADGALMGTDFSYYDFRQLHSAFGDLSAILERPLEVDGRRAHGLLFKPLPEAETRYTAVRAWVDQQTCVPLRVNFHEGDTIRKQLTSPKTTLRQTGNRWYAAEMEMRDLLNDSRTTLRILEVSSDEGISDRYFQPGTFYTAH
ncbi:MAG: outer membrane lipoprotein-sorting protein [Nevskiales bacterium]